jgi:hypothetical protein
MSTALDTGVPTRAMSRPFHDGSAIQSFFVHVASTLQSAFASTSLSNKFIEPPIPHNFKQLLSGQGGFTVWHRTSHP